MSVQKRDSRISLKMARDEQGMVLVAVIILLLFAFLLTTAVLAYVYSSNLTTFSKEHRMVALERAEAGLNKGALDMITLHADLPEEITLPTGYSHADYVEFLDGLDDAYYVEDASGDYRYYLTDDEAIIGYGWRQDFKRIVRCEYSDYYFPVMETPAALYIDSDTVDATYDGNVFKVDGNDHTIDGGNLAGGTDKYGILTTAVDSQTDMIDPLKKNQEDNIKGGDGFPSIGVDTTVPVDIDAFSAQLDDIADYWFEGDTLLAGTPEFGSRDYPIIMVVNGDLRISGTVEGWGILDVRGSMPSSSGNMTWHGLVIVSGDEVWMHGNPDVIGSMWIKSDSETIRISGDPSILYSTAALDWYADPGIRLDFTTWEEL